VRARGASSGCRLRDDFDRWPVEGLSQSLSAVTLSPDAHALYDREVSLRKGELGSCKVRDTVTFAITLNNNGQPQARAVLWDTKHR
jgi:hypothetical protein